MKGLLTLLVYQDKDKLETKQKISKKGPLLSLNPNQELNQNLDLNQNLLKSLRLNPKKNQEEDDI